MHFFSLTFLRLLSGGLTNFHFFPYGFFSTQNYFVYTVKKSTRIIGGNDAPYGRYPYMVSLLNEAGEHTCGGSLVAADVVITAAHCRYGRSLLCVCVISMLL